MTFRISRVLAAILLTLSLACDSASGEARESPWRGVYDGYGSVQLESGEVLLSPRAASRPEETHAALVLSKSPAFAPARDFRVTLEVTTEEQLRSGSAPNPWECFWLFFNTTEDASGRVHANYFVFKSNGIELGRAFGDREQAFLATLPEPRMQTGKRARIRLTKVGQRVDVEIDGRHALAFESREDLFDDAGAIGLYTEDARVRVHATDFEPLVRP